MQFYAMLVLAIPLLLSAVNGLWGKELSIRNLGIFTALGMFITLLIAFILFINLLQGSDKFYHYELWQWLNLGEVKVIFAVYVDKLTTIMFLVVTLVSFVVHIYSLGYMREDENLSKFLAFLSLFTFFMLLLVAADNFIQLFFGWEGVGLCSYLLIGYWYHKDSANSAAMKAFITNRVSDFAFILGIVLIVIYAESVDFKIIFTQNFELLTNSKITILGNDFPVLDLICLLLFIGCMGKSAQIGLHIWLPDAMEGPTPVSALIHAATMVTAGVFLLARCSYLFEYSSNILNFIAIVGGITSLFAATIAIAQSDIKKIIAYSTCSQLGYMFVACGVSAYNAAIFHLATHATFKALLFLAAGNIIHATHQQDISYMGGLRSKMPITYAYFILGSLAIMGIAPFAGYYSKDMILEATYGSSAVGNVIFWLGIIVAVLTAIYSSKILLLVFHGKTKLSAEQLEHIHEGETIMNLPLVLLAGGAIFSGIIGYYFLSIGEVPGYFGNSIFIKHYSHTKHDILIDNLPSIAAATGIIMSLIIFRDSLLEKCSKYLPNISKLVVNKYYFDEIYDCLIVKNIGKLANYTHIIDRCAIDGLCSLVSRKIVEIFGRLVSWLQSGYIVSYVFMIIISIIACVTTILFSFINVS